MIVSACIFISLLGPPRAILVDEFFPIKPGTIWRYVEKSGKSEIGVEDRALKPEKVGSREATGFASYINGQLSEMTVYAIDNNTVMLIAVDPKRPFEIPYPIFQGSTSDTSKWRFDGNAQFIAEPTPHVLVGEARLLSRQETVLGRKVDVVEVRLKGTLGAAGLGQILTDRKAKYGKGIGLFQSTESTQMGKEKHVREKKLVAYFEPLKGGD